MKKVIIFTIGTLGLVGCAEYGGVYHPVVDQAPVYSQGFNNPNVLYQQDQLNRRLDQDMYECRQLAKRSANTIQSTATDTVVGGALGAAGGAIAGAFLGNPGAGAAIGAAAGGFGGLAKGGLSSDDHFKQAYNNCLIGRGHRVIQ